MRLKEKPTAIETVDLPASLAPTFDKLLATRSAAALDTLLSDLRTSPAAAVALDADQEQYVVASVAEIVRNTLPADVAPFADSKSDERALQSSIGLPLFRLFRCMYQYEEKLKKPVAQLLRQVFRKLDIPVGHLMLYYLKVTAKLQSRKGLVDGAAAAVNVAGGGGRITPTNASLTSSTNNSSATATTPTTRSSPFTTTTSATGKNSSPSLVAGADSVDAAASAICATGGFKTAVYRQLCDYLDESLEACLARDLGELETASAPVFLWLLPDVVREFKPTLINNTAMLRVLCGCLDARGLRDLIYSVTQGKLTLFKNEGVLRCVRDSLVYETFEQYCLWQLVLAHDVPIEYLQVGGAKCERNAVQCANTRISTYSIGSSTRPGIVQSCGGAHIHAAAAEKRKTDHRADAAAAQS